VSASRSLEDFRVAGARVRWHAPALEHAMAVASTIPAFDLDALIHPLRAEDFFAEHWERRPLHHRRGDESYYAQVLTTADLDRLISAADLRYPAIQLARHGGYFPPEVYTTSIKHGTEVWSGVPDIEKILREYRSGATVVLPALHRTWAPLRELCAGLERHLSHAVHANAYLTAGNTTGFLPHHDTHEVFVLQIGGKKCWRVHAPPVVLPHRTQPFTRPGPALGAPLLEVELRPGDLLYLPRGYVHSAATSDSFSAHVTVGVTVYTWVELLAELAQSSKDLPSFRAALPVGFAHREDLRDALKEGLATRLAELLTQGDGDALVDGFKFRVRSAQPRAEVAFRADTRVIGPRTELARPEEHRYLVATEEGNTTLFFDGRKLVLPAGVRSTLDAICARPSFRFGELPPHLEDHATLAFVQFLEGEGFLRQVDAPEP